MTLPYPADETPTAAEDGATRLGGRYEILEMLGRGGMAEVFRAHDHALGRTVAVKLLPLERRRDGADGVDGVDARRLQDEARAAAGLSHPHVVAVHDVGSSSDGVFVVMEMLGGRTWRQSLRDRGPAAEAEVARIGAQVASALAAAHARGVLHRDVNPGNVMLDDDGHAKLMDFGIARLDEGHGLTETGKVVGTPAYMAPEQVRNEHLDGACDVYSLGCTLYEAATGRPPFQGISSGDTAAARLREPPVPPRLLRADLSVRIEDLIMRAMALQPRTRPDAASLSTALQALADGGPDRDRAQATAALLTDELDHDPDAHRTDRADRRRSGEADDDVETRPSSSRGPERPPPAAPSPGSGLRRAGTILVGLGVVALILLALWLALR